MSNFRGGGIKKDWIIEGKNRIKGWRGGGVKNDSKKLDIIKVCMIPKSNDDIERKNIFFKKGKVNSYQISLKPQIPMTEIHKFTLDPLFGLTYSF